MHLSPLTGVAGERLMGEEQEKNGEVHLLCVSWYSAVLQVAPSTSRHGLVSAFSTITGRKRLRLEFPSLTPITDNVYLYLASELVFLVPISKKNSVSLTNAIFYHRIDFLSSSGYNLFIIKIIFGLI